MVRFMEALTIISWVSLALGVLSSIIIYVDIQMGCYQSMRIMNIAWPVTSLFIWPLALFMYFKYGRSNPTANIQPMLHSHDAHEAKPTPLWVNMYIASTHCASGCAVADIIGEAGIFILGITIAGSFIWMGYIVDYVLALIFGLAFQYYSIRPMQPELSPKKTLWQAVKADIFSLTSFQIGMYIWIYISVGVIFNQAINASSPIFWFMMQIAMICGMFTTMPVNHWLIKIGIKHACH